jgi:hypothetical protein
MIKREVTGELLETKFSKTYIYITLKKILISNYENINCGDCEDEAVNYKES